MAAYKVLRPKKEDLSAVMADVARCERPEV